MARSKCGGDHGDHAKAYKESHENKRFTFALYTDSSQDHAIIDLLAGLEDDGVCRTPIRQNSQSQSLTGSRSYHCNSDDEEAGPELDKEEAELSVIMSQRWDNKLFENSSLLRQVCLFFVFSGKKLYVLPLYSIICILNLKTKVE